MTSLRKITLCVLAMTFTTLLRAAVPTQPSVVTIQGTQLMLQKRLSDGTLSPPIPYTIKGVDWSPATRAPDTGPIPPGYPFPSANSNQYGFFFDWAGRNPEGDVVMNYWLQQEAQAYYQQDIALMAQMHVNTVRLYTDFGDDPTVYGPILDAFYNNGIMVIMTVPGSQGDIASGRYLRVMNYCKNHPAILMWAVGNEWNLNLLYGYPDIATAEAAINNTVVPQMKSTDTFHPVSSSLGDPGSSAGMASIVNAVPNVDLWALNIYRGATFGTAQNDIFTQWTAATTKPFYFSEFGIDSFSTDPSGYTLIGSGEAHVTSGHEDEATQSSWDLGLWNLIQAQLSSLNGAKPCLGGFVFSWNDALWKVGNFNVGLGNLPSTNYTGDTDYNTQEPDGFYIPGGFPDNIDNEEYFGIVNADRVPKQAYVNLQSYYATLAPLPLASIAVPSSISVHYNQTLDLTAQGLDAFQEVLFTTPTFTWSVSPNSGVSLSAVGTFTSFVTSGTYLVTVTSGAIASSIQVTVANAPPTVAIPIAASPSHLVIGSTATLTVVGADDRGEPTLLYTWTLTGGYSAGVQFLDVQGQNDSKTMRVLFLAAGNYDFTVTLQDLDGAQTASQISVTVDALSSPSSITFAAFRVYPSPWRSDLHAGHPITFDGLTANTTVKIFTISGHWVQTLVGNASIPWDLKNSSGDLVASGLYLYLITDDQGQKLTGKFAIIR